MRDIFALTKIDNFIDQINNFCFFDCFDNRGLVILSNITVSSTQTSFWTYLLSSWGKKFLHWWRLYFYFFCWSSSNVLSIYCWLELIVLQDHDLKSLLELLSVNFNLFNVYFVLFFRLEMLLVFLILMTLECLYCMKKLFWCLFLFFKLICQVLVIILCAFNLFFCIF